MNGLDEPPVAQDLGGSPDGEVGDAVLLRDIPLCGQACTGLELPGADPRLDVVGYGDVDELGTLRVEVGYLALMTVSVIHALLRWILDVRVPGTGRRRAGVRPAVQILAGEPETPNPVAVR